MTPKEEWLRYSGLDYTQDDKWLRDNVAKLFDLKAPTESQQRLLHMVSLRLTLADLPDAAYRRLCEIENPTAPLSGILKWDNDIRDWTDGFAGQYRCFYPGCTAPATQNRVHNPGPAVMLSRLLCDVHAAASDAGDPAVWE